jgi:CRP-like cAMP-binding protein
LSISVEVKEITFLIYKPGDFFPFFAALIPSLYPYWIETMTPCEIISIPVDKFMKYFETKPTLFLDLAMKIMGRFDKILQRMEYLAFGKVEEKMASILLILSEQFGKGSGKIDVPLTHKEIANLIGITRETASGILSGYEKKGYIEYQEKFITIKNKKALLKESLLTNKI